MPFLSPKKQCQSTEGKISHSTDLLTPSSSGGLPTLSSTTNSSWLPWGGLPCLWLALWCQYPLKSDTCREKKLSPQFNHHATQVCCSQNKLKLFTSPSLGAFIFIHALSKLVYSILHAYEVAISGQEDNLASFWWHTSISMLCSTLEDIYLRWSDS